MKISACVITKNEEKNIALSINSYRDVVDEIIVVDSESTDGTVTIAEGLGAKVYNRPWTNDFGAAKNYALDKATGDWIIFLDADEFFFNSSRSKIRSVIETADKGGYECLRIIMRSVDRDGRVLSDGYKSMRIFKRISYIRYVNKIHEVVVNLNGPINVLDTKELMIHHTGYAPDILDEKHKRNLELLEADATGLDEHMKYSYLIETYFGLGRYDDCLDICDKAFALENFESDVLNAPKLFRAYCFKIQIMIWRRNEYSECQINELVGQAVEMFGNHPEVRARQADVYASYGRIDKAIWAMNEAFRVNSIFDFHFLNDFTFNLEKKYMILIKLYKDKSEDEMAIKSAISAILVNKNMQENQHILFSLFQQKGLEEKHKILSSIYDDMDNPINMGMIINFSWISGNIDLFTTTYLSLLKQFPDVAQSDELSLCRIFFLQKNYTSMLDLANKNNRVGEFETLATIAELQLGNAISEINSDILLKIINEFLRANQRENALGIYREFVEPFDDLNTTQMKATLSMAFENFKEYECATKFSIEAARCSDKVSIKVAQLIHATMNAYKYKDYGLCITLIKEVYELEITGKYLPVDILGWILAKTKKAADEIYTDARRLKAKYEAKYSMTMDQTIPDEFYTSEEKEESLE